jgi:hypothetical protein
MILGPLKLEVAGTPAARLTWRTGSAGSGSIPFHPKDRESNESIVALQL